MENEVAVGLVVQRRTCLENRVALSQYEPQ